MAGNEDIVIKSITTLDFDELRSEFNSLKVLLEQVCKADMKVIATNPERIWKHEQEKGKLDYSQGWKPDTTQLSAGALFQISEVMKITGVSGKGWNESSEYIMGKIDDGKWIRLINFRGYATAIPDTDTFKRRTGKIVEKIHKMEHEMLRERERREMAEKRLNEAELRVAMTEDSRRLAEQRVKDFEVNFKKMEELAQEKEEVAKRSVDIAKREAQEAKVLMRYFEDRMTDSEENYRQSSENLTKAEETTRIKEAEVKEMEDRIKDLERQLEQSERIRLALETKINTVSEDSSAAKIDRKESTASVTGKSSGNSKKKKPKRKKTDPVE